MADFDPFLPSRKPKQKTYGKSTKTYDSNRLGRKLWVDLKDDASKEPAKGESEDDDEDLETFLRATKERAGQKTGKLLEENRTGGGQKEDVEGLVGELSRLDIGPLSPLSEHEDKNEFNLPSSPKLSYHRKSLSKKEPTRDDEEKENIDPVESLLTELALEDSATDVGQLAPSRHGGHGSRRRSQRYYSDRRTSIDSVHDKGSNSMEQPLQRQSRSPITTTRQDETSEQLRSRPRAKRKESNGYKASNEALEESSETTATASSKRFTFAVEIPVRKKSPSEATTSTASRSNSRLKRPEGRRPMDVDSDNANSTPNKPHRVAPIPAPPLAPTTPDRKGGLRKKKDRASSKSLFTTAPEAGCFLPEKTSDDSRDIVTSTRQPLQPSRLSSRTAHVEEQYEEESEEDYFNSQLEELLEICTENDIVEFTQYIKGLARGSRIKKLGEASYSEVFLQSFSNLNKTKVLKIIPFGGKDQCLISQIIQEVRITQTMAQFPGFVGFEG
jgi:hypothetical protein